MRLARLEVLHTLGSIQINESNRVAAPSTFGLHVVNKMQVLLSFVSNRCVADSPSWRRQEAEEDGYEEGIGGALNRDMQQEFCYVFYTK